MKGPFAVTNAKAVQGMPAGDAVKSAHGELVKIYT